MKVKASEVSLSVGQKGVEACLREAFSSRHLSHGGEGRIGTFSFFQEIENSINSPIHLLT